ncbi:MAG: hypothetical protein R3C56_19535 [Pirellulaceae bacterium]
MPQIAWLPARARLFPLYLTPFEEYMLWDDRTDYPMTFVVKMEFDGKLNRDAITGTPTEGTKPPSTPVAGKR